MTLLLVLLGGAVGAPARYLTDRAVRRRYGERLPWGTLVVNVVGSLILGVTAGLAATAVTPDWVLTLVGTGFCGALTTFSTFGYETVGLVQHGRPERALLTVAAQLGLGLLACSLGWLVGTA